MRLHAFITATLITGAIITTPVARAECDISQTKCALNGGKCNIHFTNRTGDAAGSDGSSVLHQSAAAQAVTVKAVKSNGKKAGNKLVIQAYETKTMNLDKKAHKHFSKIHLRSQNGPQVFGGGTITCDDIVAILDGNGKCKLFTGVQYGPNGMARHIGYQCDSGNVGGPNE